MTRPEQNQDSPSGAAWTHYLLIGAIAMLLMSWRLGDKALDEHECYVALPARTMADPRPDQWLSDGVEHGAAYEAPPHTVLNHWMVPVLNGHPRLEKTPLAYWCVALATKAHGATVNEWVARLPSAIAAVLLCLVTLALGRRMFSPRAALLGAILLVTSTGLQKWGRNARPEMLLCLFMTLAMACFYLGLEARTRGRRIAWMAAFWVAMGLGNLAKEFVPLLLAWPLLAFLFWRQSASETEDSQSLGLLRKFLIVSGAGLAVNMLVTSIPFLRWWTFEGLRNARGVYITMALTLGVPMLWYFIRTRGQRQLWPLLPTAVPGAAVMLAMFLSWMFYMQHLFPGLAGNVFSSQVTGHATGSSRWQMSLSGPPTYLGALVTSSLPWVAFIPGAFAVGLMKRFSERRKPLVFLLLWCIGLVGLFSAAAGKREHYILPMLPALCLLMGFVAEDVFFRHKWISVRLARIIGCGYGAAGILGVLVVGAALLFRGDREQWLPVLPVALLAAVPALVAGIQAMKRNFRPVPGLLAATMIVAYLGHHWFAASSWNINAPVRDFAASAAKIVPPDAEVFSWREPDANLVFYFGRFIPAVPLPDENPQRASWLFARSDHVDDEKLGKMGFQPALSATDAPEAHRIRVVRTLYHRRQPPSPPAKPGSDRQ